MMKVEVPTKEFAKALDLLLPLAIRHSSIPAYDCILINATDSGMYMAAVGYEMTIRVRCSANVITAGSILLPAKLLQAATSGLGGDSITFTEQRGFKCMIEVARSKTTLNGIDPLEFRQVSFPGIDTHIGGTNDIASTPIESLTLRKALDDVMYAAAHDENDELSNIYVEQGNGRILFTATDRYRVSHREVPLSSAEEFAQPIPGFSARLLLRLLKESSTVKIGFNGTEIEVMLFDDHKLISYATIGTVAITFPHYRKVIAAQSYVGTMSFVVGDLLRAVKVTAPFLTDSVLFRMTITELAGGIALECQNVKQGNGVVVSEVPITVTGEVPDVIVYDYQYVLALLNNLVSSEEITVAVTAQGFMMLLGENDGFDFMTSVIKDEKEES